jgi:predicted nucleic acid-binding protein
VKSGVLLDTGPLVAILHAADSEHAACVERLHDLQTPLLTCWPVLTEAAWLLRHEPTAIQGLLFGFRSGLLRLLQLDEDAMSWIAAFYRKYRKLSPQLADAALVYLAERENLDTVFTLDRRDFSVYRMAGGRTLHVL